MNRFADEVYREHGAAVLRLATRLCRGDRGLAEDVLQGTVTRAWRHAAELRASDRHLRPWLFTFPCRARQPPGLGAGADGPGPVHRRGRLCRSGLTSS